MCSGSGIYHIATKLYFRVKGAVCKCGQSGEFPSTLYRVNGQNVKIGFVLSGSEFRSVKVSISSWEIPHVSITCTITAVWDMTQEPQESPLFPKVRRFHNCESPNLLRALPEERTGTVGWGGVLVFRLNTLQPEAGQLRHGSPGVQVSHFMTDITRIQTKYLDDKCSNREFSAPSFLDQPNQERCSSRKQTQNLLA